jgi:hypothetical protein
MEIRTPCFYETPLIPFLFPLLESSPRSSPLCKEGFRGDLIVEVQKNPSRTFLYKGRREKGDNQ